AGKLSLLESVAVVELCDIMICNDSGALHIADAVKTDVISFFGPTVKSIGYFPYRENDKVLEVELDCRPCSSHGTNKCPLEHHNCMKMIEPDFVVQEVIKRFT
ncbi:MAG: glycosyltransferase family 9 protein, partial [Ignavibacteriae bacterium]|nr:glycosyltransferase family 9 protein [Ignavibacteriota bacterium]